ncbi:MAG TPA: squalene/phytoene synthase family protein [Kofleriaceae bacterium]|nr:squalene/phytoene synthase family protein [Kofleriaceae bacterium]
MDTPESFARRILPDVSRTFALNIPVLPQPLDLVVTVAYLLCRIADTLEDEGIGSRTELFGELAQLVALPDNWQARADEFTKRARRSVRAEAPAAEVELLANTRTVLQALANLPAWTQPYVARCVGTMAKGMDEITRGVHGRPSVDGLSSLDSLMTYCYYVAGTVGEMLTGLFISHSKAAREIAHVLEPRARAFGRALQLTNILKDVREDLDRGICWLPKDRLAAHGLTVRTLALPEKRQQAVALLDELVGVARQEIDRAFEYTLALPESETGLRLFCLWPLFFSVLTLQMLEHNPAVLEPAPVKLTRETIKFVMVATQQNVTSDVALRAMYHELQARPAA